MKEKGLALFLIVALCLSLAVLAWPNESPVTVEAAADNPVPIPLAAAAAPNFADTEGHWAKSYIEAAAARGWIQGTTATTFSPDTPLNRGMFVTILGRMADAPDDGVQNIFADVPTGAYYAPYVAWAYENAITDGVTATAFEPDRNIARQELAAMLYRFAGSQAATLATAESIAFNDAGQIAAWASEAVDTLTAAGIITGKEGNRFDPLGTATRAEATALLARYGEAIGNSNVETDENIMYLQNGKRTTDENIMYLQIGERTLTAELADNSSAVALKELLAGGPLTIEMSDYNRMEKVGPLGVNLPRNDEPITTKAGDLILYQGNRFVIYYDANSYALTRLGRITDVTADELSSILGTGDVTVTLSAPAEAPPAVSGDTLTTNGGHEIALSSLSYHTASEDESVVYFISAITPAALMAIYEALEWSPVGNVAVKLSTGEPPASNYLAPDLIEDVVRAVDGTIVECNTAYGGSRAATAMHRQVAEDHGFTAIAEVDIQDADGSMSLPVTGGIHLTENHVGAHFADYDSYLILSHFKGHAMAGFGGAIKNISIGLGSSEGKSWIHSAGSSRTSPWGGDQDDFLESMGEAGKSVTDHLGNGEQIVYINVMNRLSVDCDCDGNPAEPDMHDIGILASRDPVALDQACVDLVYAAADGASLIKRIESRNGVHTLEYAEDIGLGSRTYELVSIEV